RLQCIDTGVQNREQHITDLDGKLDDVIPQNPELSSSGLVALGGLVGEGGVLLPGCVAQLEALAEQVTRRRCGTESIPDPNVGKPQLGEDRIGIGALRLEPGEPLNES